MHTQLDDSDGGPSVEQFHEITYECSRQRCGNKQTIRFFATDPILPVTCCVSCRAGFGMDLGEMIASHVGMFPVRTPVTA